VITVVSEEVRLDASAGATTASAFCPDGTSVIGGGHELLDAGKFDASRPLTVLLSMPSDKEGWRVTLILAPDAASSSFRAYARCAK
jgi:hypothetical protein